MGDSRRDRADTALAEALVALEECDELLAVAARARPGLRTYDGS